MAVAGRRRSRARLRGATAPRASSTPRRRRCASRCAVESAGGAADPLGRCSTPRSRSPRAGARYDEAAQRAAVRAVRAAGAAGATTLRTLLWTRTTRRRAAVHGRDHGRPARAVHLRPRGRRLALPRRARRRRGAARVPVQRHASSTPAPGGRLQIDADLVGAGGRVPAAGARSGARRWTATSPARAWLRLRTRRFDRLARLQGAPRARRRWEDALDALLPARGA